MNISGGKYRVVAGVDGSAPAQEALRWAVWHASVVGGSVTALSAWNLPGIYSPEIPTGEDFTHAVEHALSKAVEQVVAGRTSVVVREKVVHGHAAWALLEAASTADLLVVGNRGHGGLTGALLGSVSQYCVHHAKCPVVVIREDGR